MSKQADANTQKFSDFNVKIRSKFFVLAVYQLVIKLKLSSVRVTTNETLKKCWTTNTNKVQWNLSVYQTIKKA